MDQQEQLDAWIRELSRLLPLLVGEQQAAEAMNAWDEYSAQREVVALLYGPYDAGKSTLLKRLLVENGTPVPGWLTISGRLETFETSAVVSGGMRYVDSPGSATANARHTDLIHTALTLADALVLVLPPQLLTTQAEQVLSVLDGGFYDDAHRTLFPDGAVTVVVTQSDTMGVDPDSGPELFRARCEEKREELRAQLARAAHATPAVNIHVVSADPDQRVGPAPAPTAADYLTGQGWDEIHALRADLRQLPARRDELRRAATQRYWAWATAQALAAADNVIQELRQAAQQAARQNQHIANLMVELEALDRNQRIALRNAVQDELRAIADKANVRTPDAVNVAIHHALGPRVDSWATRAVAELQQFADRAQLELTERARRSDSGHFSAYLNAALDDLTTSDGDMTSAWSRIVGKLPNTASAAVKNIYRILLEKMTVEEARAELDAFHRLVDSEKLAEFFETSKLIGPEHAKYVEKIVKQADIIVGAVPVVLELGSLYLAERGIRGREQADRQERVRLREKLDDIADRIADGIIMGGDDASWSGAVEALRKQLAELRLDKTAMELDEQATSLAASRDQLDHVRATGLDCP